MLSGLFLRTGRIRTALPLFLALGSAAHAADLEIHGSNTVGATLAPMLMEGYLKQLTGNPVVQKPSRKQNEKYLVAEHQGQRLEVLIAAHGSSTGFTALDSGEADLWASSRPAKTAEIAKMKDRADLSAAASEHVIAIDGLAILVHPSNPVNQVSIDTLGKIFSGEIRNWSELGGPNQDIKVYARDNESGTWDTFKSLVLGKTYSLTPAARRYESNDQLSADVSKDPAGIGFAGLASVGDSKLLAVSDSDAPALRPNQLTVASEDYPLARRLFFYSRGDSGGELLNGFLEYAQGEAGQELVAASGFISQTPIAVEAELGDSVPASFRHLTRAHQRLSVNFRFAAGHTDLDNKAQRDLKRIQDYLRKNGKKPSDLMLIGFADQQGDELRAQMISELRALSVSKALRKMGSEVKNFTGYGQYMPVGSAGGADGARRNGRVEVWVRR